MRKVPMESISIPPSSYVRCHSPSEFFLNADLFYLNLSLVSGEIVAYGQGPRRVAAQDAACLSWLQQTGYIQGP